VRQLGSTSLFAARFRETAARALLLPRRRPGMRTPLWQQRKRASDLLAVASRFGSFPALLETYREVLRDHFDMPALVDTLRKIASRTLRVSTVDSKVPSPFAASLLFSYVANYIYDGDAPLAERRAHALSVDQAQLRELLGDAELRELLDPDALIAIERQLQHLDDKYKVRTGDGLHDLLIRIGDLTLAELEARSALPDTAATVRELERARRIVSVAVAGERRFVAAEDVARYRDALGAPLPPGLPEALLAPLRDPAGDLALRFARSHAPFTVRELAARYGLGPAVAEALLLRLTEGGKLIEGEFRPGGVEREWVDPDVLRSLRRRSLARLRQEIEPVDGDALGRFAVAWHSIGSGRQGLEALLDAIEQLQSAAIPASVLEREILPARVADYRADMLDTLVAAGEVVWVGVEPLGGRDGRIALYLTDQLLRLRLPSAAMPQVEGRGVEILAYLREHGASFFAAIHQGTGQGFPKETVEALWDLVWKGLVTNDTLHPLRAFVHADDRRTRRPRGPGAFRSRRLVPPTGEGRWSVLDSPKVTKAAATEWGAAMAQQLLTRHGVITRETVASEALAGGFSAVYQVLRAMEEAGRIRRGYFVAGLGAAQFAMPAAVDLLRSMRDIPDDPRTVVLAATDPANLYGSILPWPELPQVPSVDASAKSTVEAGRPTRSVGARTILVDGKAAAYLRRGERDLLLFLPDAEPRRSHVVREIARMLMHLAGAREEGRRGMLIVDINGDAATAHPAARLFIEEGFAATAMGLQSRALHTSTTGIRVAGTRRGGHSYMADPRNIADTREEEHDQVRSSNDRDQELEQEGIETEHNRGYDDAVRGAREEGEDLDPDAPEADIDRDDSVTD
jgi:ATP-dependent helicase Lhr and Lhr-like helicase